LTVTITLAEALPHVSENFCSPKSFITTDSRPEVDFSPDQAPDAVQDAALVLAQVSVEESSTITVVGFVESDTEAELLPPLTLALFTLEPPPPQEDRIKVDKIRIEYFKCLTSQNEKDRIIALLNINTSFEFLLLSLITNLI
jgi:hypothetical protein